MKTFIRSFFFVLVIVSFIGVSALGQNQESNISLRTNRPGMFQLKKSVEDLFTQQKEKGQNLRTRISGTSVLSQQNSKEGTSSLRRNTNVIGHSLLHTIAFPQSSKTEKQIFTPSVDKQSTALSGLTAIGDPTNINAALTAGANYVRHAQSDVTEDNAGNGNPDTDNNDGGWDWMLTLPNVTHSSSPSPKNLYGATGLGLYYGYLRTNNSSFKIAMQDAADKMIADTAVHDASALKFLMLYNDLPGIVGTAYKDSAKSKYDTQIAAHGGTATLFGEFVRDRRGISQGYHNGIIGWDLGAWSVAAQMLFERFGGSYHNDAVDIANVAYNASFVSNANYFDIVRCAGWDPTYANSDYWWYNLGISGLVDAFRVSGTHTTDIAGLVTKLQNSQASFGGFCGSYGVHTNDDDWQTTAYAVMSLAALNPSTYATEINHGAYYLAATQNANGGWVYSDNTHYPEVGGECTSALYFGSNASTVWVDDDYTSSSFGGHMWGFDAFSKIQNGIDGVALGGTVNVYPGNYVETASSRMPVSIAGTYTFGLYIGQDKNGITVQGVDALGNPITDYHAILANIQTEATNNFGPDGIFMEGDNVTITGLNIWQDTLLGTNKTISVIGDNFTFKYCRLRDVSSVNPWGSLYIDDEMYNAGLNISHIQKYTIEGNWFDHASIDPNNGAGYTGPVSGRVIRNNLIDLGAYAGASISFTGSGTPVPWFVHGVGGAVITGNTFLHNAQHIRARGDYNNSQFDWLSYWNDNTFDKAVAVGVAPPADIREYSYTGGYGPMNHCRRIGGIIQNEVNHGQANDIVKVASGIYDESISVAIASLTLTGLPGAVIRPSSGTTLQSESIVYVNAVDNVTVQGFEIDGTANTGVHYGFYAFNSNNSTARSNIVHDIHNRPTDDGGVGILFFGWGQGITGALVDGNTVYNCDRMGAFIGGMETVNYYFVISGGTIQNNTVYNTWQSSPGDWGGAIQINAAMGSTIQNNTIRDTKIGANYRGIVIDGSAAGNSISGNFVYNNAKGITIWSNPTTSAGIDLGGNSPNPPVVHSNSIYSNTTYGLRNTDTSPLLIVDASGNWWGSADTTLVAVSAGVNVDYTPWFNSGTDTQPGTSGFQGDYSNLWVDDNSPQSGSTGRIQEGINLVTGSTVNVAAGTYSEILNINKSITLLGANSNINPNTEVRGAETIIDESSIGTGGSTNFQLIQITSPGKVIINGFKFIDNDITATGMRHLIYVPTTASHEVKYNIFSRAASTSISSADPRAITITPSATGTVTVDQNYFLGSSTADLFNNKGWRRGLWSDGGGIATTITNNVFKYCRSAINLDSYTAAASITGNTFQENGTALSFGLVAAGSYAISGNTFNNAASSTVFNLSGGIDPAAFFDATANTYDGLSPTAMTLDQLFTLEYRIVHRMNTGKNGFVMVKANNVYVVPALYGKTGSVQGGIDAASSGWIVNIAAGTFEEQLEITKTLTLLGVGTGSTIIKSPPTITKFFTTSPNNNYPIVYVHDVDGVTISDLAVDGFGRGNSNYRFIGVGYRNAGGTLSGCTIKDIKNSPIDGAQHGVGLYANADDGNARTLNVSNNTIFGFQKNGTVFAGANLTVNAIGNMITGAGAVNFIAQNGIQIYGAAGSAIGNHITGFTYTPASWTSTGMLIYNALGSVSVIGNNVSECQTGIYFINAQGTISQDTVTNTFAGMGTTPYWWGIVADPGVGKSRLPEISGFDIKSGMKTSVSTSSITTLTTAVNNNIMNGGGNGTGIEADALGTETLNFSANQNSVTNWGTGFVLYKDAGATLTSVLRKNSIAGNLYGVLDQTGVLQDARENWWGHASGPADPKTLPNTPNYNNLSGIGDSVSSYVDYKPWYVVGTMDTLSEHTIAASAGNHGTISPAGSIIVAHAKDTIFNFTPDVGYHVDSILVDGVNQGSGLTYTIHNVRTDHIIRVVFAINTYTLNTSVVGSGSIVKNPNQPLYNYGVNVQLTAIPVVGYHFVNWSGDTNTTINPITVTMNTTKNITANFAINTYTITASAGTNGSINPSGVITLPYGSSQLFNFTPDQYYQVDSIIVDGSYMGSATSYNFTNIAANHIITVKFGLMPSYVVLYRTFTYEELPVSKSIKKKPASYYWEFKIKNTTTEAIAQIYISFKADVLTILSSGNLIPVGSRASWNFYGVLQPNDSVIIKGRSSKSSPQQIKLMRLGSSPASLIRNIDPIVQKMEYPMPNLANVREDAYLQGAFAQTSGLVVGIPQTDSARFYGWVRMTTPGNMFNSLIYRSMLHSGQAQGFQKFDNGTSFVREQKSLSPRKQNNRLFADLLALKFNIALSRLGITERGLGELRFIENGNPYTSMLVRDIAKKADSLMTFYITDLSVYDKLDSTLAKINRAFSGVFDTISWSTMLKVKGTKNLLEVTYLQPSGIIPERTTPIAISKQQMPEQFKLSQNYPNPFNPSTTIQFTLPTLSIVTLKVYNIIGQEVFTIFDQELMDEGLAEIEFHADNIPSGVYFYRITAEEVRDDGLKGESFTSAEKMLLLK